MKLKVGNKIKFSEHNYFWKVRACDERYAICTAYQCYTILDLKTGVRNYGRSWNLGHRTDEECQLSLLALNGKHPSGEEQSISSRGAVKIEIQKIKEK